jgi:hypothetical protein
VFTIGGPTQQFTCVGAPLFVTVDGGNSMELMYPFGYATVRDGSPAFVGSAI